MATIRKKTPLQGRVSGMVSPENLLRLLTDVSEDTAVDVENVTVDEVGCITCKEDCRSLEVLCITPACCGSLGNDELIERMT